MKGEQVSVYAVGDVIPDWPNPESLFALVMPTLAEPDILFGQLEAPLAASAQRQMQAYFARRVGPEKVSALTSAIVGWYSSTEMPSPSKLNTCSAASKLTTTNTNDTPPPAPIRGSE